MCVVWDFVCMCFVIDGCFDNCVGDLVICVLVLTVFFVFLMYILFFFVLSVPVSGLLPPGEKSVA